MTGIFRMHLLWCAAIGWWSLAPLAAQTGVGAVRGRVADTSGAAVAEAAVQARTTAGAVAARTSASSDGEFALENLTPGAYTLVVRAPGLAEKTHPITLQPDRTLTLQITLAPPVLTQSVDVTASVDAVSGVVTKMDVPLLETPQAITIIPREQFEQQAVLRVVDALRYTAGVSAEPYGFDVRGDWAIVRASDSAGQYLNGLRMFFGYYNNVRPEPFSLERIEVMRGPSSVLFGQSGFGGVINAVSKRPQRQHAREIEVQVGNYQRRQVGVDATGPLGDGDKLFYRFIGVARDSNTQVQFVPEDRLVVAPSLTWRPQDRTSLTVLTNFQQDKTGSSVGFFPWEGTLLPNPAGLGRIPTDTFISEPGFDEYRTEQTAAGYLFAHEVNSRWTIRQNFNYTQSQASYRSIYSRFRPTPMLEPDGRTLPRTVYISQPDTTSPVVDTQSETTFDTGAVRHTVVAGVDYQKATIDQLIGFGSADPIDVFEPVYGNYTVPALNRSPQTRESQTGLYAQDHMRLTDKLSTMLGVRKDWARSETEGDPTSRNEDGAVTGRAGVVYNLGNGVAPYFSFSQSFQPLAGTDINNTAYDPIRAKQWEIGTKFQPGGGRTLLQGSAFDIREQNRLTPDPTNPLNQVQLGEAHIRGFELEARSQTPGRVDLLANYTFLDARISESNAGDQGFRLPSVPKHAGSLWAIKSFQLEGVQGIFSGGGGIRYTGSSFDGADSLRTPKYTLFDLMFGYELRSWRFSVNAANVGDKVYVGTCLARGDCFYGTRRQVTAKVRYRF